MNKIHSNDRKTPKHIKQNKKNNHEFFSRVDQEGLDHSKNWMFVLQNWSEPRSKSLQN